MMSQILHSDVCFKDQASVETSGEVFISRYDKTAASGGKLLQAYVNQDDPNHLPDVIRRHFILREKMKQLGGFSFRIVF